MTVEEEMEDSVVSNGDGSIQPGDSKNVKTEVTESLENSAKDHDTRLKANTQRWKYTEAVPNAPGEPPNPTPVLPDIEGVHTGLFLQQFTNSVNKALHKQHCTCKGTIYTSQDLYEKSNPALFGRSKSDIVYNPIHRKTIRLPRLVSDNSLVGGATSTFVEEKGKSPLQVQIERESKDRQLYGMHFDGILGDNNDTVYDQDGEIRLPNIMDIHDLSGNSWKVIQEPKKGRDPKQRPNYSRFYGKLFSDAITENDDEFKSRSAKSSASKKRDVSFETKIPKRRQINVNITSATAYNSQSDGSVLTASSESLYLPNMEPLCNSAPAHVAQIRSPPFVCDEIGRKALLWRYASAVRKGEITYRDYLQKVSDISSLYRCDDDDDDKRQKRELSPQQAARDSNLIKIPRADIYTEVENKCNVLHSLPSAYERQRATTVNIDAAFPPELEFLYSKAGLSVSNLTDSFSKSLPENFLEKEKDLLRNEYPMYDWKIRQKAEQIPFRKTEINNTDVRFRSHPMTSDARRCTGIGPRDFDHTVKVISSRSGLEQNVINIRSSQFFDRRGDLIDIPETEIVKKITVGDGESSRIESGLSRGFPPNQPPTTPVEVALTYASCSVPNIMETMEEETGQEAEKNIEKEEDESDRNETEYNEPAEGPVANHVTRRDLSTAKSQKSERSWKEGFDGKMYKVSKERQLKIVIPATGTGKDRKRSFDSKGDEISTISDVIPPNPYNSNENIHELDLSNDQRNDDAMQSNKRESVSSYSKVLPVTLLGADDMLPGIPSTALRSTVRSKSSSKSELNKDRKEVSTKQYSNAQSLSGSDKILPVTVSTKQLVFVSPIE